MKVIASFIVGTIILGASFSHSSAQEIKWLHPTRGVSVAVDAEDNVFTVDFEMALGSEMSVTKRDANGGFLWQASYDQTDLTKWERASWIATDHDDNVIICGTSMSGLSNPVEAASILMKWDKDGNLLWRNVFESNFDGSSTRKCLIDANNNIYVLGMGSGPQGFVTKVKKFSPDGTDLWSYFDSAGIGRSVNFKFTPDGFITITGRSIFGSINGYAKIDQDGNEVWSFAGVSSLTVGDCDGDAFGNTYLVNGEFVANGGTVVTKLGPDGNLIWENVFDLAGFRVEVGSDNRAVVSGFPNPNVPGTAFIKVDENGGLVWSNLDADGPQMLLLHSQMLLDDSNNAYLAAGTLFEMAVCKVNGDGSSAWTQTLPGGSFAHGIALANNDNGVFVVGGNTARIDQGMDTGSFVNHVGYGGTGSSIDTGKVLAKEGPTPTLLTYDNLINTSRGINGLVFDIANLPGTPTAADFQFQMSPTGAFNEGANPVNGWELAPSPSSVAVVSGSPSRVVITWPDNAIVNRWLRVTVKATANTGLQAPEVYYIGHLLGETMGPSGSTFTVSFADITPIRSEVGSSVNASSTTDIDKNGTVAFADISAMRLNVGAQLTIITIPAAASSGGQTLLSDGLNDDRPKNVGLNPISLDLSSYQMAPQPVVHRSDHTSRRFDRVDSAYRELGFALSDRTGTSGTKPTGSQLSTSAIDWFYRSMAEELELQSLQASKVNESNKLFESFDDIGELMVEIR